MGKFKKREDFLFSRIVDLKGIFLSLKVVEKSINDNQYRYVLKIERTNLVIEQDDINLVICCKTNNEFVKEIINEISRLSGLDLSTLTLFSRTDRIHVTIENDDNTIDVLMSIMHPMSEFCTFCLFVMQEQELVYDPLESSEYFSGQNKKRHRINYFMSFFYIIKIKK